MKKIYSAFMFCFFILISVLGTAHASYITYEYTGNEYNGPKYFPKLTDPRYGTSITASVTFNISTDFTGTVDGLTSSEADQLLSWSITSGAFTITSTSTSQKRVTNSLLWNFVDGAIVSWDFNVADIFPIHSITCLQTKSLASGEDSILTNNALDISFNQNLPGAWHIPEPCTILLLGLGFVGLAGVRRKFRH